MNERGEGKGGAILLRLCEVPTNANQDELFQKKKPAVNQKGCRVEEGKVRVDKHCHG